MLAGLALAMQSRHVLVFGFEGHHVDARIRPTQFLGRTGQFFEDHDERTFRRIALQDPTPVDRVQGRVATKHPGFEQRQKLLGQGRAHAFLQQLALGGVTAARHAVVRAAGPSGLHRHLVLRERTRFVGADDARAAEGFHRGQSPHDGATRGHAAHADRERDRDDGRQPLGDGRHGERDRSEQGVRDLVTTQPPHPEERDGHGRDPHGQGRPDLREGLRQGRLEHARLLQHRGNLAELRRRARTYHDAAGRAVGHERAAVGHVHPIAERGLGPAHAQTLLDGHGLARERGLFDFEGLYFDETQIGRDLVAALDEDEVPRHEELGADLDALAVAPRGRPLGHHGRQRLERLTRAVFLHEADDRVQHDHAQHDAGVGPLPHERGEGRRPEQDVNEGIVELPKENFERTFAGRLRQGIRPETLAARRGLGFRQPFGRAELQSVQSFIEGKGMERDRSRIGQGTSKVLDWSCPTTPGAGNLAVPC